jgi:oligopeptide transport system substrate-binding protein
MTRNRPLARVALAAALVLSAAAAAAPAVIRQGTAADPPSLDPSVAAGSLAAPVITDLFVGLVTRDAASRPIPGCAESWQVSADGRTWTFRLRPALRWSDGTALTAEDFVWSFRRLVTPSTGSLLPGLFFFISGAEAVFRQQAPADTLGVTAPDARTVVLRLDHPVPYLVEMLANLQVAPVPRHAIEKHGRDWTRPGNMVSNGAFVLAERVPQNFMRLTRNPNFFDAAAVELDEVFWYPTQDLATSLRRFRAGELDTVLNFPPDEIEWLRRNMPESLRITPTLASYFLVLNTQRKPFDDARVRRALSLAIDRDALTGKLLRTGVKPAWSFASPEFKGYGGITVPAASQPLAARQAEARRLLAAAGFGPDRPLTVPLLYDTQEENRKIMVAISAMWNAVGVKTELTNLEFGALNGRVRSRNYDVARWTYFASFDDAYAFLQLLRGSNPNNWVNWRNARYDELLEQSNGIADPARRAAVLREAEALMVAESPVIPIYHYVGRRLVSPAVKGWVDTPGGTTPSRFLWVER